MGILVRVSALVEITEQAKEFWDTLPAHHDISLHAASFIQKPELPDGMNWHDCTASLAGFTPKPEQHELLRSVTNQIKEQP